MKNRINLDLYQPEKSAVVLKALASPVRLKMLYALVEKSGVNISELAEQFQLPLSSAALHVRVLEEAGLIFTQEKPGVRGAQKICAILAEDVYLNLFHRKESDKPSRDVGYSMPLGNYFDCSVTKPCGIAGRRAFIGIEDSENAFYSPNRIHAQLIWFTTGFLEYRFSNHFIKSEKIRELSFSFEACSEAPGYDNEWPSDITVWINHQEVFTFRSAGDYGGKRGIYNPDWWPDTSTQYGELHRLEIFAQGCFGDGRKSSDLTLEELRVSEGEYISFKIGVKEDNEYPGGINLFGEHFGNYRQNISLSAKLER
ncbi:MAG: helix-turn-helix domain-containing protein [Spirochaetaceae bacterium]|jgi:predicted transcriptional regulator|nr:helix-turn-helix domain-containing protein [Spirochaetaceae bacterium]